MNAILVGGAGDGTRIVLQDHITRYDLAVWQKMDLRVDMIPKPFYPEIQHYNLFRLHPVTRAVIFAHKDLTPTQIMERLLDCYRPKCDGNHAMPHCDDPECWQC